ncbi:MAG: VTT domain-containing protein [Dehalococcoidia bacterium]|nr:VTT domain-containing protein [Dehalococcoidia bacterium]
MNFASGVQFFRERLITRRWFQILIFVLILALSFGLFLLARSYLPLETLLRYGYLGIFLISLSCVTIVFPLPWEAVVIAAGTTLNPLWVGVIAATGATIGELSSYLVGYLGRKTILGDYLNKYQKAEGWLKKYGSIAVFVFALLPILIFDLLGIAAGSFKYPLWKFVLACWAGRLIRCLVEAYLGRGLVGFLPQLW